MLLKVLYCMYMCVCLWAKKHCLKRFKASVWPLWLLDWDDLQKYLPATVWPESASKPVYDSQRQHSAMMQPSAISPNLFALIGCFINTHTSCKHRVRLSEEQTQTHVKTTLKNYLQWICIIHLIFLDLCGLNCGNIRDTTSVWLHPHFQQEQFDRMLCCHPHKALLRCAGPHSWAMIIPY